jgi:hypothetical protein
MRAAEQCGGVFRDLRVKAIPDAVPPGRIGWKIFIFGDSIVD